MQALADQIDVQLGGAGTSDPLIENLQVVGELFPNATPPAIDVYPADPFQEGIAYGRGNNALRFTVRARVNTPDHEGAQLLLLSMMDPRAETSLALAVLSDKTLGGKVDDLQVSGPSDYGIFDAIGINTGAYLGCTWLVEVLP